MSNETAEKRPPREVVSRIIGKAQKHRKRLLRTGTKLVVLGTMVSALGPLYLWWVLSHGERKL